MIDRRIRPRALVLGGSGFLGANVALALAGTHDVVSHAGVGSVPAGTPVLRADLTDPSSLRRLLDDARPDLIVNCAALADVDRCETDRDRSIVLNVSLPERLARACALTGTQLVHVSTDAVFDGVTGPFGEEDEPRPISAYGRDKRAGELAVLAAAPGALIVRTNIIGWSPSGQRSLLEFFHDRLARGTETPGFTDIRFRPLPVQWFWPICAALLAVGRAGIVHATGPELVSKYEFGRRIADTFGFDGSLVIPTIGLTPDRPATRAPLLDVLPSTLPSGSSVLPGGLDDGLDELRDAAEAGVRTRLRGDVTASRTRRAR